MANVNIKNNAEHDPLVRPAYATVGKGTRLTFEIGKIPEPVPFCLY